MRSYIPSADNWDAAECRSYQCGSDCRRAGCGEGAWWLVATDQIIQQSIALAQGTPDALTFRYVLPNRCGVGTIRRERAARHRGRL